MSKIFTVRAVVFVLIMNMAVIPQVTYAGLIGTQSLIDAHERGARVERIDSLLTRDAVHDQLVALGVAPEQVQARLSALTDDELRQLESRIDTMPAGGGVLEVLGIVFVVLLVLELTGVTNIFTRRR